MRKLSMSADIFATSSHNLTSWQYTYVALGTVGTKWKSKWKYQSFCHSFYSLYPDVRAILKNRILVAPVNIADLWFRGHCQCARSELFCSQTSYCTDYILKFWHRELLFCAISISLSSENIFHNRRTGDFLFHHLN